MAEWIYGTDYRQYLQQRAFVTDLTRATRESAQESISAIQGSTKALLEGMEGMGDAMGAGLSAVEGAIGELNSSFEWGFSNMLAGLGQMNDTLESLVKLTKNPARAQAYEQFDIARDDFRKQLYIECLKALGKAIGIYREEWRFHELLGLVRLGVPGMMDNDLELIDLPASEQSFLLTARYARADDPKEAAKALLFASRSAWVQQKMPEALKHAEGAFLLDAGLGEAIFQAAKVRMALGEPQAALPVLRQAIDLDRGYLVKAAGDEMFQRHSAHLDAFLAALRGEKLRAAQLKVAQVLQEFQPLAAKSSELAASPVLRKWQAIAKGANGWGLLELVTAEEGFEQDLRGIRATVDRLRSAFRFETTTVRREIEVEAKYEVTEPVEETFWEDVVVRPAGFFRSEQKMTVKRTRTVSKSVTKTRKVRQQAEERKRELVNGFGETKVYLCYEPDSWVTVNPGRFKMGDRSDAHDVTITRGFELQTTPVTQAQWQLLMGKNPSTFKGDNQPVENVNWFDAVAYCNALSKMLGFEEAYSINGTTVRWKRLRCVGFRLPTEAEWEYACRAGTTGEQYGDLDAIAWYDNKSEYKTRRYGTHPVKEKQPNAWGFYDMLGNVREWCWDRYGDYSGAATDPVGSATGSSRIYRGGAWNDGASNARSASRNYNDPDNRNDYGFCGFRPLRLLP